MSSKIIERVVKDSLRTVGYSECENKESFIVGARVSSMKMVEEYEKEIENLKRNVESYRTAHENVLKDMSTLTGLIKKYTTEDGY